MRKAIRGPYNFTPPDPSSLLSSGIRILKKICILFFKKKSVQNFSIGIILFCCLFFLGPKNVEGAVFDYHGARFFYGESGWTSVGPHPADSYQWFSASYMGGKKITDGLSLESQVGAGFLQTDHYDDSSSIEWRVLLSFKKNYTYLNLGIGLAHLFNSENLPNLHDADIYGLGSASIGLGPYYYKRGDNIFELTLGYSLEHISAPFDDDGGCNVGALKAKISWNF